MSSQLRSLVVTAAVAVAVLAPGGAAHAQPAEVRNVVLVHGAFADGSGWRGVHDELTARGYRVTIVQNPLTSLADDVAATKRVLDRQDGPTVLVGHSWGGSVITEAGVDPKVTGLVYVSGLAPDAGETTGQQYADYPAPPDFVIDTGPDGFGFLNDEKFKAGFAADTSDQEAAFLRDAQVPVRMAAFEEKLTQAAWRTKPSWAVVATQDEAIDPRMLRQTAQRIGAEITEVEGSHVLFLTHPRAVADVIDRAAKESGQL
ncbi:alpha/beta hydrolase [Mycobacterium sp. ITM-2016-00317]|uniref:alpha/beta fold hydrolase n=1 Tax=Mycobacterium sp. ITM-2016-00317 TaxID=2099694 RepID=UPI000D425C5D|nr:alpha/beta hydrolase [Mycobacterium sp. ITM-2016-00317]WNG88889.1 alpha/beta hydrolase [Mycobacterium sp. ITM-2016-00317]